MMVHALMANRDVESVSERLRVLRDRAGYSMARLARECGYKGSSSYQRYEDSSLYTDDYLPLKLVLKLEEVLPGKGDPPITKDDVMALAGLKSSESNERHLDPEGDAQIFVLKPDNVSNDLISLGGTDYAAIRRFDARLSAGHGSIVDPQAEPLGYHLFERQWLNAVTRAAPESLAVVRVDGDSMEHTLNDGDWILVDRSQRRLNREGIYALQVGDACWVKRVTLNLRDRLVRVISDNPIYPVQELSEEELTCIGRVVWIVGRAL